ncbi:MAG: hypothetical protein ACO3JL_21225, partial [Myxococcota bacterium]
PFFIADADTTTKTNPNDNDTDNDGVLDGAEDGNQNGKVDTGELNPRDPNDVPANSPVANACASPLLPNLHQQQAPDTMVATHPNFTLANGGVIRDGAKVVGLSVVDTTNQIVGFALRIEKSPPATGTTAKQELDAIEARVGGLSVPLEQTFTTWDGFDAVRGTYDCSGTCLGGGALVDRARALARTALRAGNTGSVEVPFTNAPQVTGNLKVGLEVVKRTDRYFVVVGALTSLSAYDDPATGRDFRLEDLFGGSALAQVGDTIGTECNRFVGQPNQKVDFIWVVDDSGSMSDAQDAVSAARTAMEERLAASTLDWRIGLVTTQYWKDQIGSGTTRTYCDFVTTTAAFKTCLDEVQAANRGDERGFESLKMILSGGGSVAARWLPATAAGAAVSASKVRADAQVVVIFLSDAGDQSDV